MRRLDFRLNDFTRVAWAPNAKEVWEPMVNVLSNAWQQIEVDTVLNELRPSALLVLPPEKLPELTRQLAGTRFTAFPVAMQAKSVGQYTSSALQHFPGQPFDYRVVVTRKDNEDRWHEAWAHHDDPAIGILLGYPSCCREFFMQYWVQGQFVDTTWFQALHTEGRRERGDVLEVVPYPECNVTLRPLGIRCVSHLPCSFVCKATRKIGEEVLQLVRAKHSDLAGPLEQILNWPVKWSSLHGIAEILTPACRIVTRTDSVSKELIVQQQGAVYPPEGSRGLEFPFRAQHRPVTVLTSYSWKANGFPSLAAMIEAHRTVLKAVPDWNGKSVIDLGCGTGELLSKMKGASELHGVDTNTEVIGKARAVAKVRTLNIFDPEVFDRNFDIALISVQRLTECDEVERARLLADLMAKTGVTIFYSYGLEKEGWRLLEGLPGEVLNVANGSTVAARFEWNVDSSVSS